MEVEGHDRGGVPTIADPGVDAGLGTGAVIAVAGVDGTFFRTREERSRIRRGKGDASRTEVFCFGGGRSGELEVFLGLGEHVDGPSADDTIGGAGDDVVCVLGAYKREGVDGVSVAACGGAG